MKDKRWIWIVAALLAAAALLVAFLQKPAPRTGGAVQVTLDGKDPGSEKSINPGEGDLRVYITLDGAPLLDLPFAEAHQVRIALPDGGENTVTLTGSAVFMKEANCEGQDCVQMGEVTRENLEMRVMGGFIVCLPHRVSVEVR